MSWHHDFIPHEVTHRADHTHRAVGKRHARAKAMMHPDDLYKIAILIVAGTAAAVCIFTLRILAAGLGG